MSIIKALGRSAMAATGNISPEERKRRAEAKRLAERKRVDNEMRAMQKSAAKPKPKPAAKPTRYPVAIKAMGPGFKSLYDTLGKKKK